MEQMNSHQDFWEKCWQSSTDTNYSAYLKSYYKKQDPIIELFRNCNISHVCDAACGFGAYSLMLASNGFLVEGFDIAPTSVAVTKKLLQPYGIDTSGFRIASVLETGYDRSFDAVTAISVLDHMSVSDARKALNELLRIVKPGGLLVVSFDSLDGDDLEIPHKKVEDGSILYTDGTKNGMIFHFYSDTELKTWFGVYNIIQSYTNSRGERFYVIQK